MESRPARSIPCLSDRNLNCEGTCPLFKQALKFIMQTAKVAGQDVPTTVTNLRRMESTKGTAPAATRNMEQGLRENPYLNYKCVQYPEIAFK